MANTLNAATSFVVVSRPRQATHRPFFRISHNSSPSLKAIASAVPFRKDGQRRQLAQRMSCAAGSSEPRQPSSPASDSPSANEQQWSLLKRLRAAASASAIAAALAVAPLTASPAMAADTAQVGTCLLESCQGQLAGCLTDGNCLKNLICLNQCNGREDESECQIKCGDLYESKAVQSFNDCAVSSKKCVPQRVDTDLFPVPLESARDRDFDLKQFTGRWYITAGLNPLFDTFPCQEHFFGNPEPGVLFGKINWRVPTGTKGEFLQRGVTQTFKQTENPAVLLNRNNAYLHYEDDWYILASKPNEYVLVYYIGNNDAWKGYGGATVYTRESKLPEKYIPELRAALEGAGVRYTWDDFTLTDNSCPAKPMTKTLLEMLGDDFKEAEKDVEQLVSSFGQGFNNLENELVKSTSSFSSGVEALDEETIRELKAADAYLAGIQKQYETTFLDIPPFKWFFGKETPSGPVAPAGKVPAGSAPECS